MGTSTAGKLGNDIIITDVSIYQEFIFVYSIAVHVDSLRIKQLFKKIDSLAQIVFFFPTEPNHSFINENESIKTYSSSCFIGRVLFNTV